MKKVEDLPDKPWQMMIEHIPGFGLVYRARTHTHGSIVFSPEAAAYCGGEAERDADGYVVRCHEEVYQVDVARYIARLSELDIDPDGVSPPDKKPARTKLPVSPVGLYFVEVLADKRGLGRQGQILGQPEPGWYLVSCYEWLAGTFSHAELIPAEVVSRSRLHLTHEGLIDDIENGGASKYRHPQG